MSSELGEVQFRALGTTAHLLVTRAAAIDAAEAELLAVLEAMDRACSRFRDDSELAEVNMGAGRPVPVSGLFVSALEVALRAAVLTDGDVDPTVGSALQILGYDRDFASLRDDGVLPVQVTRVQGWRVVELDSPQRTVRVPRGVALDLGATAKAYAADLAADRVHQTIGGGVLVNLGGDIAVAGSAPSGGWPIEITDDHATPAPVEAREVVSVFEGGLATSSTTVRRWQRAGDELHHIVDPSTGTSAPSCWRTVSVAAATCVDANIAATASIVRGGDAPSWLARLGLPARLVGPDGRVTRVAGWASVPS